MGLTQVCHVSDNVFFELFESVGIFFIFFLAKLHFMVSNEPYP